MKNTQGASGDFNLDNDITQFFVPKFVLKYKITSIAAVLKKIRGGFFLVLGYLLSPLSWWNDLFFNMPVAYAFGYLCSLFDAKLLVPCSIVGYWISNVLGIVLMQAGVMDVFQNQPTERNFKKELLTGLASSTVYTLIICGLFYFKILDVPNLFP
ncbi:hypothetical protein NIES4071_97990 [Calothrix sp. NIES-4071]|nr:hypothetical protein NIES4071_97990 [Calothrix sp. NIES-4071]BAZ64063.1 hypothetical protein NIES4105_97920 [Calothrix sp. NIES-4105]